MKKSARADELSDNVCEGHKCNRRLKKRRVEEYDDTLCYRCHQKKLRATGRGHRDLTKAYLHP